MGSRGGRRPRTSGAAVLRSGSTRHRLGVSQERLGFLCGLDRTYVSAVERGVGNPTILVLWSLAKGLETSVSQLLRTAEEILEEG